VTLEAIHDPAVMEAAQKQLAEKGNGPLTSVCSMQGFFPYKVSGPYNLHKYPTEY
jgi:hypothetical protein